MIKDKTMWLTEGAEGDRAEPISLSKLSKHLEENHLYFDKHIDEVCPWCARTLENCVCESDDIKSKGSDSSNWVQLELPFPPPLLGYTGKKV